MADYDFSFLNRDDNIETGAQLSSPIALRKAARRNYLSVTKEQSLRDIIRELPPPGVDLWIISNGNGSYQQGNDDHSFEFGHFVPVVAQLLGGHDCTCYLSTWSMNHDHIQALFDLMDTQAVTHFAMITDRSFRTRKPALAAELVEGLQARQQRFLAFPNHAKVLALATADGAQTCVVFGSANLSQQPRAENYTLTTDPTAYQFVVEQFFEAILHAKGD